MRLAVGLIVFAALLRGLVWAVALPPWQGPDEPAHFAYIQRIATTGEIPAQHHAPPDRFSVATEVSVRATGYLPFRTRQPLRLLRRGLQAFPVERDDLPQKNHGGLITWKYPPAYYLVATPAYLLPFLHTDTERLYAVRSVSAILGAITVWLVLALLLEAGVAPAIALLGVSAYALLPMVSQASAICNPDVLLMAALAGLARSLLVLCRGWNRRSALVVALWALLATLTKPIGGPAAAMVIVGVVGFGMGARTVRRRVAAVVAIAAALVVTYVVEAAAATWSPFGTTGPLGAVRYGLSYLWQFYLPPLSFMDTAHSAYRSFHSLPSWRVWVETGTGFFGWLTRPDAVVGLQPRVLVGGGRDRPRGLGLHPHARSQRAGASGAARRGRRLRAAPAPRRGAAAAAGRLRPAVAGPLPDLRSSRSSPRPVPAVLAHRQDRPARERRAVARRRRALGRGDERCAGVLWLRPRASGLRALWRPRDVVLALLIGLVVTVIVIWRDADRADATYVIGAAPSDPLGDVEISGVPRRSFALPRLSPGGRGRVLLQIATYFEPPTATLRLQVLDANGHVLSRCTIAPGRYRDNGLVACDVPDVSRAKRVVVLHAGRARLGVYAHAGVAGYLAYTSGGDLVSRVRSVLDRVGISLPAGLGPAVLIGGLWLSTAAPALAALLAIGLARSGPDALLEHGEPLGETACSAR